MFKISIVIVRKCFDSKSKRGRFFTRISPSKENIRKCFASQRKRGHFFTRVSLSMKEIRLMIYTAYYTEKKSQ